MVSTNTFVADAAEGSRHLREAIRQSRPQATAAESGICWSADIAHSRSCRRLAGAALLPIGPAPVACNRLDTGRFAANALMMLLLEQTRLAFLLILQALLSRLAPTDNT